MFDISRHRSFRSQILVALMLLGVFGAAPMAVVGKLSVDRINEDSLAHEIAHLDAAVARRVDSLPDEQRSATIWDDAILEIGRRNAVWMEGNLGVWMQTYFGHDLNFVLNPALEPIYAAVDQRTRSVETFDVVAPQILPLAQRAREMVLSAELDPAEIAAADYVRLPSGPALVSVVPIIPDTTRMIVGPTAMHFHVAVDRLDAAYVAAVTDGLALSEPTLGKPGDPMTNSATFPLEDKNGVEIARLEWTPAKPATRLVTALAPALAVWIGAGAILVFWLAKNLMRTLAMLQESEAQARYLAYHDTLTELPNRALFEERLAKAIARKDRTARDLTLLMLDLDQFKNVNDTLGHPVGDDLIRQVGKRIQSQLRKNDLVARLGGDEFAVILDGEMAAEDLVAMCERLLEEVSRPYEISGNYIQISVSIGACRARKQDDDAAELVRKADIAMYQAKNAGRRRHCFFAKAMDRCSAVDFSLDRRRAGAGGNDAA